MHDVYIILGAARSGRRAIVFDLIDGGLSESEPKTVYRATSELASPYDEQLVALSQTQVIDWEWNSLQQTPPPSSSAGSVFFMTEGTRNPIDQIEALRSWMQRCHLSLARIITVVDCQLAERNSELSAWYHACIHFTDYALLNHRETVAEKWIRAFQRKYQRECYPCLFGYVKKNKVGNPVEVLDPEPRRISHYFDEIDAVDTLEIDEENLPDEVMDLTVPDDPYLQRLPSGQRKITIPDIKDYL